MLLRPLILSIIADSSKSSKGKNFNQISDLLSFAYNVEIDTSIYHHCQNCHHSPLAYSWGDQKRPSLNLDSQPSSRFCRSVLRPKPTPLPIRFPTMRPMMITSTIRKMLSTFFGLEVMMS